jgi:hypothetical protein
MIDDAKGRMNDSLLFKGRAGVGMGRQAVGQLGPIPLLTSPLKGEECMVRP